MGKTKIAISPGFDVGGNLFTPEQLSVLGSIVGENARIEMTSFKQLYVELEDERAEEVKQRLAQTGLQVHPAGFYTKSLIACNFCRGAEEAGLAIAKALDEAIAGQAVPSPLKIGYAGCALGTSEPLVKDIGVVKMKDRFDIYVGGEPKSLKAKIGILLQAGVAANELIPVVQRLIDFFSQHGKKKEPFSRFIERMTIDKVQEAIKAAH